MRTRISVRGARQLYDLFVWGMLALAPLPTVLTVYATQTGVAREANPLAATLFALEGGALVVVALRFAVVTLIALIAWRVAPALALAYQEPRVMWLAWGAVLFTTSVQGWDTAHDLLVILAAAH